MILFSGTVLANPGREDNFFARRDIMQMELQKQENGTLLIMIDGDMDAYGCSELQDDFDALVNKESLPNMTLHLGKVDFLDSSGIGAIVFLFKRLKVQSKSLSLIQVHGQPMEIIQLLRINSAMSVEAATAVS